MKRKKLKKRRYLAMLLAFVLCMGMLDISAFAAAPNENIAAGAGQEGEGGQTPGDSQTSGSGQAPGGSQTPDDMQTSGGGQTSDDVQKPGDVQTPEDVQKPEDSQTPDDVQKPGDMQTPGDVQKPEESQTPEDVQKPEDSQTFGNLQNTGAKSEEENVKTETGGDTETGEKPEENAAPEYAAAEEFWAAVDWMGETDDEDSVREAIEKILSIYGCLSEEDKADEAVQKAYEELMAYAENLGQDDINPLDDTYTVIYQDSAEYGGRVLAECTDLEEGDQTPGYENSWFEGKDKDFKMWSPAWNDTVGGENHKIVYTAVYEEAKTYRLRVHFRWAGADSAYAEAAPSYTMMLKNGEDYSITLPKPNVPFAYTTALELDGKGDVLEGTMKALAQDIWIDYYPLFQVNHIYRRDGNMVGYVLWNEDFISWYDTAVLHGGKAYTYGSFNSEIYNMHLFRYPWVFWDANKPNEYETFVFTSEDVVKLSGNPADLKATPVVNLYYDKTTYVDVAVRYIYEAEDGTETELLEEYRETLARNSGYDVSEQVPATIEKDGLSYRQDSVDSELMGTAAEDKTITVKYVIVKETAENPTEPTEPEEPEIPTESEEPTPTIPPVNPPGGGGGGTPAPTPTPEPPTPEPTTPGPVPVVPIPAEPVPQAAVTNVTSVTPTPVAAAVPEEEETVTAEIEEERVPLADGKEPEIKQMAEVEEEEVPLAGGEGGSWALFNFALMNLAIFESIMLLIGYFVHTKNEEDKRKLKKKGLFRIISLPVAVISLVVFVLTENIYLQTALVDKYTVVMLFIAVVQTVMVVLSNRKYEQEAK